MLANLDFTGYKEATVFLPLSMKGHSKARSWIGAILFLFFFALPLHFHITTDSQQISRNAAASAGD